MTENIYIRDDQGALVLKGTERNPAKRYSDIGREEDGTPKLREWRDDETAKRDAEEAAEMAKPHAVPKATVRDRLYAAGLLKAAYDALYAATDDDAVLRAQLWDDAAVIRSDDQRAIAFLRAIGADPAVILAR